MNSLNQVIIEGNVVRQPEKKEFSGGTRVCSVPIAVNRWYKNSEGKGVSEVSYFDVTAFGNLADVCEKWCPKGRGIRVVGRLKQDVWEKEGGEKKSKVSIIAEHVEFKPLQKKEGGDNGPKDAGNSESASKKQKLAMLKEAAQAAQYDDEEAVF